MKASIPILCFCAFLSSAILAAGAEPGAPAADQEAARAGRRAQYEERQTQSFERMRQRQKEALAAAETRRAPDGPSREYFVNNETGDDGASGLAADKAVRTLARGVSLLKPGDTLLLAATRTPYRETLHLGDGFGGLEGKPTVIDGNGATLTGCDPLRLDGWQEAGTPGLYKSAKFLGELEEFDDVAKLMRVFFVFDGVVQHMGRSSKGGKAEFKEPSALKAGEWTYVEREKAFYLKVNGNLADAKVEAPYRRNGVAIRSPKTAMTHVVIKNLIVCHVLNDGFNVHGTTKDVRFENIAAYECGDDGFSPHDTCEVAIDGFWSVGNSTGIANGNLSVVQARNVRLEGNLAHQFMSGHGTVTELRNSIIAASAGTQPISFMAAQNARLALDNVQVSGTPSQKIVNIPNSRIEVRRSTVVGPSWENAAAIEATESVIGGRGVTDLPGGSWTGEKNVYAIAFGPEARNSDCESKPFGDEVLRGPGRPFPNAGADPSRFKIPPRPVPLAAAGKFTSLALIGEK